MSNDAGISMESSSSSSSRSILNNLRLTLGNALVERILSCKLLLVGAGGIGCELLKNLALTGFNDVTVIDLDTIDVSNLNRQLLFRSHHVGQPKCVVASDVAAQLAVVEGSAADAGTTGTIPANTGTSTTPTNGNGSKASSSIRYVAMHGNVCDNSTFHVEFVKPYALILNALDNVVARRRVNRLALAAGVPLIEAGTTGYLGQVTTIHKPSNTACYECQTQETGKVYPICTIRSTPSAPVHCIVWAKELYKLLFGESVEESMLYEDGHDQEDAANGDTTAKSNANASGFTTNDKDDTNTGEPSTYMPVVLEFRALLQQRRDGTATGTDPTNDNIAADVAVRLVRHLYVDEIQKQLDMNRYKTAQKKPVVLKECIVTTEDMAPTLSSSYRQTDVWSTSQCVAELVACCRDAYRVHPDTILPVFDKDDTLAMRFVTSSSNLRAIVFGIEPIQSFYSAKGIAGNIIPAIATTNAIVAGLQILQCFAVLKAQLETNEVTNLRQSCSYVNCLRNATRNGLFLTAVGLEQPNPKCFVCTKAMIPLSLNVNKWTLQDFIVKICKGSLGFENPSIAMDNGGYIWEEGDDADSEEFAVNLPKRLPDLPCGGIHNGTVIAIEDFSQDLEVQIAITHVEVWEREDGEDAPDEDKFVVGGQKPKPVVHTKKDSEPAAHATAAAAASGDTNEDDSDDIEIVANPVDVNGDIGDERKKRASTSGMPPSKKPKLTNDNVIEIDD